MRKTNAHVGHHLHHDSLKFQPFANFPNALGSFLFLVLAIHPISAFGGTLPNSLTLAWDTSPTANVSGYRVYFGSSSLTYTDNIELGNVTTATISDLPDGPTFFAIAAISSNGLESGLSSEVCFRPGPAVILLSRTAGGIPQLTVQTTTGRTQEVQASSNLIDWALIDTVTLGSSGTVEITDSVGLAFPTRFYRTQLPNP
jgi:hypothetical protein